MTKIDPSTCSHVFVEKTTYECEYCNKQFTTAYNLNRHKKSNCQSNVCQKCNLRFAKQKQLLEHIPSCNGMQPHQCEFCGKSFQKRSNLGRHRQTHTEKCERCHAVFYRRLPLVFGNLIDAKLRCYHCEKTFPDQAQLDEHAKEHFEGKFNVCDTCKIAFAKKRQLQKHIQKHHPQQSSGMGSRNKSYECTLCARVFRMYRDYKKHLQMHTDNGEKVYKCRTCGQGYSRKSTLKMHMYKHLSRENKPRCDICRKVFSHPYCLRAHMRIHDDSRPFKCSECGKCFRQQGHLNRHNLIHQQEESVNIADYSFVKNGERICKFCRKGFSTSDDFKRHLPTHALDFEYECTQCMKSFSSKQALIDHNNIHTGNKPFKCNYCALAFPLPSMLARHKQTHPEFKIKRLQKMSPSRPKAVKTIREELGLNERMQNVQSQRNQLMQHQQNSGGDSFIFLEHVPNSESIQVLQQPESTLNTAQLQLSQPPMAMQNQLQPIHNTPAEQSQQVSTQNIINSSIDVTNLMSSVTKIGQPVDTINLVSNPNPEGLPLQTVNIASASDMPTYWHLQQSNFVQYHHPTTLPAGVSEVKPGGVPAYVIPNTALPLSAGVSGVQTGPIPLSTGVPGVGVGSLSGGVMGMPMQIATSQSLLPTTTMPQNLT